MAIDQREALIAAVRAQVEKEKAAKAAKLKKEQEAMQMTGKSAKVSGGDSSKPKYKTLSAEELAQIEEKKRRKHATEMGIVEEETTNAAEEAKAPEESKADTAEKPEEAKKSEETKKPEEAKKPEPVKFTEAKNTQAPKKPDEAKGLGMSVGIQADKSGKTLNGPTTADGGLAGKPDDKKKSEGLGLSFSFASDKKETPKAAPKADSNLETKSEASVLFKQVDGKATAPKAAEHNQESKPADNKSKFDFKEREKLQPTKLVGGSETVRVIGGDDNESDDTISFTEGKTKVISGGVNWQETDEAKAKTKSDDDLFNIVPNRKVGSNDVKSMYDIDDDDDDLGAEISKLAGFDEDSSKKEDKPKEEPKTAQTKADEAKKAEEAKKKAEEAAKQAEERKRHAEEAAKKKADALEEARKREEAKRERLKEAERRAEEQTRRIAEAQAKARAEEVARKKAEEAEARRVAEEARKKAAEEARKKAAEEARKKAEEEARAKAKEEALKKAEEARKKAEEAAKLLEEAKKAEEEATKQAEENRKKAEEEAKKKAEEEAKKKAEEEAKKKAEEEAKKKAEEEAKKKAEEEAKKKAEEEAKRKAEEEARKKAEEEAKKAAEEARKKAEEAMRILEEAKKAEEEALKRAEENRKKAEAEAKERAALEAKKKAEEEAKKKAEEEAKKKAEEEAKKKAEEEAKKKAEEEAKKKAEDEARAKAAEEAKKAEEEAKKKAEAARKILEEAKKAEEEALKAVSAADTLKIDFTKPIEEGKLPIAAYYLEKYTKIENTSKQVVDTFNSIAGDPSKSRHVLIVGEHGFGLTTVGEDLARSFFDMGICKAKTIAKIKAQALNKVKLSDAMTKLKGGCLVVENAGLIANDKLKEIIDLTDVNKNDIIMILTGESGSVDRLMDGVSNSGSIFTHKIKFENLSNADMLSIAKGFAAQRGFTTDDTFDGTIRNLLLAMESGNVDRLLKTIEDAMIKCEDREKSKGKEGKKYLLAEDFK